MDGLLKPKGYLGGRGGKGGGLADQYSDYVTSSTNNSIYAAFMYE